MCSLKNMVGISEGIKCECRWDRMGWGWGDDGLMTSKARFRICEKSLNYIGGRSSPFPFNTTVNVRSADMRTKAKTASVL